MDFLRVYFPILNRTDFFLIFAAAMSFVVYVAVQAVRKARQSHQQASKTVKISKSLWSEAEFRKVYLDYRHCLVVLRLAGYSLKIFSENKSTDEERRARLVSVLRSATEQREKIVNVYNTMSRRALEVGRFPNDLPSCLDA